jgi:hypothetical protein
VTYLERWARRLIENGQAWKLQRTVSCLVEQEQAGKLDDVGRARLRILWGVLSLTGRANGGGR